jgi:hypothetical protein
MNKVTVTRNISYIFLGGAIVMIFNTLVGFAYAQTEEQTFGGIYVSLALAIISLANSVWSQYIAQKAKATGQAPNETDLRIQQQLSNTQQSLKDVAGTLAQLINFTYEKVAPEQAKQIIEGTLPLIKVEAVTKKVGQVEADFNHGADLLNEIQGKVNK